MTIKTRQSGNVLFLIFIAIGLFAALTYAVSDGNRGGAGTISKEQARLAANEILAYHADVRRVVEQLQHRGCSENDFGFSHPSITATSGAVLGGNSPTMREPCRLYEAAGGGFTPKNFPNYSIPVSEVLDSNLALPGVSSMWVGRFNGIGIDANAELFFHTASLKKTVCDEINKQLKINNGESVFTGGGGNLRYNGTFGSFADYRVGKAGEEAGIGRTTLCISTANASVSAGIIYSLVSIIIPR